MLCLCDVVNKAICKEKNICNKNVAYKRSIICPLFLICAVILHVLFNFLSLLSLTWNYFTVVSCCEWIASLCIGIVVWIHILVFKSQKYCSVWKTVLLLQNASQTTITVIDTLCFNDWLSVFMYFTNLRKIMHSQSGAE